METRRAYRFRRPKCHRVSQRPRIERFRKSSNSSVAILPCSPVCGTWGRILLVGEIPLCVMRGWTGTPLMFVASKREGTPFTLDIAVDTCFGKCLSNPLHAASAILRSERFFLGSRGLFLSSKKRELAESRFLGLFNMLTVFYPLPHLCLFCCRSRA